MNSLVIPVIFGITFGVLDLPAQTPKDSSIPASNVREAKTPRINSDKSILFTLKAPNAKGVRMAGGDGLGKGPFTMTQGGDGVWSVTIPPAVPGFHYYWFDVDGVSVNDPGSETFFGYGKETSGIEIPEEGVYDYDVKDVPHGEVRMKWYFSKTTGEWRRALVYTPPSYDKASTTRFPVLILQHGSGENEMGWTKQGHANFILDNLIAAGQAKPMIVVMDWGYATKAGTPAVAAGPASPPPNFLQGFGAFEEVVINDLIPTIDASYRTIPDKQHRAMAGLSMGGMQTLFITLHHLDKFAYIGSFSGPIITGNTGRLPASGAPPAKFDTKTAYEGAFADPSSFNKQVKLLWLGAGTEEKQFHDGIKGAADALKAAGVNVVFFESPATAHEWQTWRRDLRDFAPRLFR